MYKTILQSKNSWLYITVLLLEGYLTLSVEILSIRQLIPFVGNSVIATSLIIGIFLLALAFGYQKGGTYRTNYNEVLVRNFSLAFYLLAIGLSYLFIVSLFEFTSSTLGLSQFTILILYLLIVTAPLVYLLGQTVPLIMGLLHNVSHTATISGFVLNISTLGSFLGSVVTSILLLNYFGVAATIFTNLLLLSVLIVIFQDNKEKSLVFVFLSLMIGYVFNIGVESNFFMKTNSYANYRIEKQKDVSYLLINESVSSMLDNEKRAAKYIEYIKNFLFTDLKLENKNIAVLGAGGFTLTADKPNKNQITYVDIDKSIKRIVEDSHYLTKINGEFVGQDARAFINKNKNTFDVVISDAYSNRQTIPFHLLTLEYFSAINDALKADGVAVFNIIGSPLFKDKYTSSVNNSIKHVFPYCTVTPIDFAKFTNLIYICYKTDQTETIYSDNLNTASVDISQP